MLPPYNQAKYGTRPADSLPHNLPVAAICFNATDETAGGEIDIIDALAGHIDTLNLIVTQQLPVASVHFHAVELVAIAVVTVIYSAAVYVD